MKKDLRIESIRETMNKDNLQETLHEVFELICERNDAESQCITDSFIECFDLGEVTKINIEENEDTISQNGDIKKIEDIKLDHYYSVYYDDDYEVVINNIDFDEVKEAIEGFLDDIEERIQEAC